MAKKGKAAPAGEACNKGRGTNLVPGTGRKPRATITEAETIFCAYYVLTGNPRQASLQAGFSQWWGYSLLKMPRIQPVLQEFQTRKKEESWDYAKNKVTVSREFLDEQFIERLLKMKTHPKVGDLPVVKMFETGYRRTGDIQPAKIVQQQGQGQGLVAAGQNAFQVYEAAWLTRKKQKWDQELEGKYQNNNPEKRTP